MNSGSKEFSLSLSDGENENTISCFLDEADELPQLCATFQSREEQQALSQDPHGSLA